MDSISKIVGNFGIWQLRTIGIIFLCKIPSSWFMALIIFTAPEPRQGEFYCVETNVPNQCKYLNESINEMVQCTEFKHEAEFYSLNMQFNLICSRDIFVAWTQFWHLFGILSGGVMATKMMLFVSPRYVFLIGILAQIACGCATGTVNDFSLHCFFRCLSALCCALMMTSGQTIFADTIGGIHKIGALALYDTFWSIGVILLPGLASFFKSWTGIYFGITLPTIILLLLFPWIPEAPRWLLKRGHIEEVKAILLNAAEINDREDKIPQNLHEELQKDFAKLQEEQQDSWLSLWNGSGANIRNCIAGHIAFAAYFISFMGMLLNIRSFGREYLVINTIITACGEIVGAVLAFHFARKFNKYKWHIASIYNIVAGIIGCLGWIFPDNLNEDLQVSLWMILSTIAKCGVSISQSILLSSLMEFFPGPKKQILIFSCVTWARMWWLIAPFINVFKKIDTSLSLTVFCLINIIGAVATLALKQPQSSNKIDTHNGHQKNGIWNVANDIEISQL